MERGKESKVRNRSRDGEEGRDGRSGRQQENRGMDWRMTEKKER